MIRRVLDFIFILFFFWVCMLGGLLGIDRIIVPMSFPSFTNAMNNVVQVVVSTILVFIWLYLWRWIATRMFWRAIGYDQNK